MGDHMNRIAIALLAASSLGFNLTTAASAADLPVYKAPPVVAMPVDDWSGFYVGIQGGYGFGRARQSDPYFDTGWFNANGGLVGITWGTNWQTGNTVIGVEGDVAWANLKGSTTGPYGSCGGAPANCTAELQWFGTSRLRLGYAFGNIMPYVTGGGAWGTVKGEEGDRLYNGAVGSGSTTRYGWTAGAGVEAKFGSHWSAKIEYLYVDLGKGRVFTDFLGGGRAISQDVDFTTQILRVGLNYKLGDEFAGYSFLPFFKTTPVNGPYAQWGGFYLGGTLGAGFGTAKQSDPDFNSGNFSAVGMVGGATAGYNWQWGQTVVGLEADASYSGIEGEGSGPAGDTCWGVPATCKVELNWFGTARARLGYAFSRHLLFVSGGAAFGSLKGSEGDIIVPTIDGSRDGAGSGTKTRFGWTVGAGLETKINDHWSTKFEYLYVDLGKSNVFSDTSIYGILPQDVSFKTHIFRTGINYSFSTGGGPVPAAY